ncbi:MAG TPA: phosphatidate cytidylyltransferase [Methylibium sp.]|uniref:phosphatidate cytidylyltransferase n=1 Tax=Methylibium sp. TaxID=2067992 RepID=UPI002DBC9484|nr:phosphatidate cytidylyltransferase [Methylibium sp.]HEU4458322.1 phosphatidate cytidylyltransferase [Methylibium sp.]
MSALRDLPVSTQVALLFVLLFGVLALVTLAALLHSLRDDAGGDTQTAEGTAAAADPALPGRQRRPLEGARRSRNGGESFHRELRAVWSGAVVFWLAWVSGPAGATLLFGLVSFLVLREYLSLMHTRRGDHRTLILAFFVVLPLQYLLVANRNFDLFTVFIPVYVFFAVPVVSALAGDPERYLERNAKIQWGLTVCIYGLSHTPALLLLEFPRFADRGAFLVFFLVVVVVTAELVQDLAARRFKGAPFARAISTSFSYRAWFVGAFAAAFVGALLYWITPFKAGQAAAMAFIASGAGTMGEFVMKALKRDAGVQHWGNQAAVTGAVGLLDRVAPLCFAAPVFFHSARWWT